MPTHAWLIVQTNIIQTGCNESGLRAGCGGEEMSITRIIEIIIIKYRKVNRI
jgi:hypothetical protein